MVMASLLGCVAARRSLASGPRATALLPRMDVAHLSMVKNRKPLLPRSKPWPKYKLALDTKNLVLLEPEVVVVLVWVVLSYV